MELQSPLPTDLVNSVMTPSRVSNLLLLEEEEEQHLSTAGLSVVLSLRACSNILLLGFTITEQNISQT